MSRARVPAGLHADRDDDLARDRVAARRDAAVDLRAHVVRAPRAAGRRRDPADDHGGARRDRARCQARRQPDVAGIQDRVRRRRRDEPQALSPPRRRNQLDRPRRGRLLLRGPDAVEAGGGHELRPGDDDHGRQPDQHGFAANDLVVLSTADTTSFSNPVAPTTDAKITLYDACIVQIQSISGTTITFFQNGNWGRSNNDHCANTAANTTMMYGFVAHYWRIDTATARHRRAPARGQRQPLGTTTWTDEAYDFTDIQASTYFYDGDGADTADPDVDGNRDWYSDRCRRRTPRRSSRPNLARAARDDDQPRLAHRSRRRGRLHRRDSEPRRFARRHVEQHVGNRASVTLPSPPTQLQGKRDLPLHHVPGRPAQPRSRAMKKQAGFTLMEVMVVVAIIAILATLAIVYIKPKTKPVDVSMRVGEMVREASREAVVVRHASPRCRARARPEGAHADHGIGGRSRRSRCSDSSRTRRRRRRASWSRSTTYTVPTRSRRTRTRTRSVRMRASRRSRRGARSR